MYGLGNRRPVNNLVSSIQQEEGGNRDIGCQEALVVPGRENVEAVGESQEADEKQDEPGGVRLEWRPEGQSSEQVLIDQGLAEAQIGDHDNDPADVARDRGQVHEPSENLCGALGNVQVCKEAKASGSKDSCVGNSAAGRLGKDFGCLPRRGHAIKNTGSRVQEGVSGRPSRGQNCGVNDVIEVPDSSTLDTDDPGASIGVGLGREQAVVGRRNEAPNNQGADSVENRQSSEKTASGLGDVASRRNRFTCSKSDKLRGGDETETASGKGGPEGEEFAGISWCQVFFECAWIFPVVKADPKPVRGTSQHDDKARDNEAHDGDELDAGKPEFRFSKDLDGNNVETDAHNEDDGNPDGAVDRGIPVVDQDSTGRRFGGDENGIRVPVGCISIYRTKGAPEQCAYQ